MQVNDWATRVEDVVEKYFEDYARGDKMKVLSVKLMTQAVARFVDYSDNDAMKVAFESQLKKTVKKLEEKDADCDQIAECLETIKQERLRNEEKEVAELAKEFGKARTAKPKDAEMYVISDNEDNHDIDELPKKTTRGRASRGGTSRRPRAKGARAK